MSKPIQMDELGGTIDLVAGGGSSETAAEATRRASAAAGQILGSKEILGHFDNDRELMVEVLGLFLDTCPSMLAAIQQARLGSDASSLETAAHSFRGAAANFCTGSSIALATRLEILARNGDLTDAQGLGTALDREMSDVIPLLSALLGETAPCIS